MDSAPTIIGLTGGIASGKSTVARIFRNEHMPVIDADELAHLVLCKDGEAYQPVLDCFGVEILGDDGEIDRQKLGAIVFNNKDRRNKLESITHPAIARLTKQGMDLVSERGEPIVFYEAALLVETGIYKGLSALIVVSCSVENQLTRLVSRNDLPREAAALRIAAQFPLEEKLKVADYIIENDGTFDETQKKALEVLKVIKERYLS